MTDLDLTEAIEAAAASVARDRLVRWRYHETLDPDAAEVWLADTARNARADMEAAVRAAAPIIERAVRERAIGYRVPLAPELGAAGWRIFSPSDVEIIYLDGEAK